MVAAPVRLDQVKRPICLAAASIVTCLKTHISLRGALCQCTPSQVIGATGFAGPPGRVAAARFCPTATLVCWRHLQPKRMSTCWSPAAASVSSACGSRPRHSAVGIGSLSMRVSLLQERSARGSSSCVVWEVLLRSFLQVPEFELVSGNAGSWHQARGGKGSHLKRQRFPVKF